MHVGCYYHLYNVLLTYIVILTAQTDLGPRSRIFSPKINKLPTLSDYKIFFFMLQKYSNITLFKLCVYKCLMNIILKFVFLQCSKDERPPSQNIETFNVACIIIQWVSLKYILVNLKKT